jgi:hypothetical protein
MTLSPPLEPLNQLYKPPETTTIAPKSQNPKAPARGAARDGSPSIRPQTNLQEKPELELPERKASPNYSNAIDAIAQL